jgi:predicted nucleic acid-binding protein
MNLKKFEIVSNTTPLIALSSINQLELLPKLFDSIIIAEAVRDEVNADGLVKVPDPKELAWINIRENILDIKERLLFELDEGEKQTILAAIELVNNSRDCLILIDERKGRRIATSLGFRIKGTLGILAEAKRKGLIDHFKTFALQLLDNHLYYDLRLIDAISREVDN